MRRSRGPAAACALLWLLAWPARAADDASFAALTPQELPASVDAGAMAYFRLDVTNTGDTTWTKAAGYELGIIGSAFGTTRVPLEDADSVAPGQTKSFIFSGAAPAQTGPATLGFQMLKDGAAPAWFGQRTAPWTVQVVNPPEGWLDPLTQDGRLTGWAYDPNDSAQTVSVEVDFDSPSCGSPSAQTVQADQPDARPGVPGAHGFSLPLPQAYRDGKPHHVVACAFDANGKAGLANSHERVELGLPAAPPLAPADPSSRWGVNVMSTTLPRDVHYWGSDYFVDASGDPVPLSQYQGRLAEEAREGGMGWARYWLNWAEVNPAPGVFDWTAADAGIDRLTAAGLNVYVTIMWAPSWTTAGLPAYLPYECMNYDTQSFMPDNDGCGLIAPDTQAFKSFVSAAVARYKGRVRFWGVWNETNYQLHWHGSDVWSPDGSVDAAGIDTLIRDVFAPGYDAIKAADPTAVVVGPEADHFLHLQGLLDGEARAGRRIFDVLSFHKYPSGFTPACPQKDAAHPGGYALQTAALALCLLDSEYRRFSSDGRPLWLNESWAGAAPDAASGELQALYQGIAQRTWISRFFLFGYFGGGSTNASTPSVVTLDGQARPPYDVIRSLIAGPVPPAPSGLAAAVTAGGGVSLSWTPSAGASQIRVERREDGPLGVFETIAQAAGSAASFTDASAVPGVSYVYRVRALSASLAASDPSNEASAQGAAPLQAEVSSPQDGQTAAGLTEVQAQACGAPARVELYEDGSLLGSMASQAPAAP